MCKCRWVTDIEQRYISTFHSTFSSRAFHFYFHRARLAITELSVAPIGERGGRREDWSGDSVWTAARKYERSKIGNAKLAVRSSVTFNLNDAVASRHVEKPGGFGDK